MAGKRGISFWSMLRKSIKTFKRNVDIWCYNACLVSYQTWKPNPELVLIDPYFQVNCGSGNCCPNWDPNALREPNWTRHGCIFHFSGRKPAELSDIKSMLQSNSMFEELGKKVLNISNMLEYLTSRLK